MNWIDRTITNHLLHAMDFFLPFINRSQTGRKVLFVTNGCKDFEYIT